MRDYQRATSSVAVAPSTRLLAMTSAMAVIVLGLIVAMLPTAVLAATPQWQYQPDWGLEYISRATDGGTGSTTGGGVAAWEPIISGDGRYVVYVSRATNMVPGVDANGYGTSAILHDRLTGQREYVGLDNTGNQFTVNNHPYQISDDGRYVTLYVNDGFIYLRDRQQQTTEFIGKGFYGSTSEDARYTAFTTDDDNLIPGGRQGESYDVIVRDRVTGQFELISQRQDGHAFSGLSYGNSVPTISRDGRYVSFFTTGDDPLAGDTNGKQDVYVRDRETGTTIWASRTLPVHSRGNCNSSTMSANGHYVAFVCDYSTEPNTTNPDGEYKVSVFVTDLSTDQTTIASVDDAGMTHGYAGSPSISSDGRYVGFKWSGGGISGEQVAVRDRQTSQTALLTQAPPNGVGNSYGYHAAFSANGKWAAFDSYATNLSPELGTQLAGKVFVRPLPFNTASATYSTPPAAPTALSSSSPTKLPTLSWNALSEADQFNIYRDGTKIGTTTDPSYTDNDAPEGSHAYYVTAVNAGGESGASNSVTVVVDTTLPTVFNAAFAINPKLTTNPTAALTAEVVDPLSNDISSGVANVEYFDPVTQVWAPMALNGSTATVTINTPEVEYPTGNYIFQIRATDNAGNFSDPVTVELLVEEPNHAPTINLLLGEHIIEGNAYGENGTFNDPDSTSWTATVDYGDGSGAQNLPLSGNNFALGHIYQDNGTYTVTISITDGEGAIATSTTLVTVSNVTAAVSSIAISNNVLVTGNPTTASATFTDPGIVDTHTAAWDWGDGTTSVGTVTESNGSGTVADTHTYSAEGVYTITLTITDKDGAVSTQKFEYISAYNPTHLDLFSGSKVFMSPIGSLAASPWLTGEVVFGISADYNNSGQPTGKAKMKFAAGNIDFVSDSITLLITSGGIATLRGTGSVNDISGYTFLATGADGVDAGGQDAVRFQIKDPAGQVIYDSQMTSPDSAIPSTPLMEKKNGKDVMGDIIVR